MKRILLDDMVIVIAGKSKGHVGKVKKVSSSGIVVEGANIIKKHVKPNPQLNQGGGIIALEKALHPSNVAIYNPISQRSDKVGFKFLDEENENGKRRKVRYYKSNEEIIKTE